MLAKILIFFTFAVAINSKHYSINTNLQVQEIPEDLIEVLKQDKQIVATSRFIDDRTKSGWTYLTIQTNPDHADWLQTYSTGYLEGFLTYELIWAAYKNLKLFYDIDFDNPPQNTTEFIKQQALWALVNIIGRKGDPYFELLNATTAQAFGVHEGYLAAVKQNNRTDMILDYMTFYFLTYIVDYYDVYEKYMGKDVHQPRCSFLMKLTDDSLFTSHTTWSKYSNLLRVYKVFDFNLRNSLVKTKRISFTSYPGSLSSLDDYYVLDGSRVVTETSLSTENSDVYQDVHPDSVPSWMRVTIANWIASDQESWADAFFSYRSGTGNNQWLMIDYKNYELYKKNLSKAKNIVWIIEEFFSLTSSQDVTQLLVNQGYLASYNVPYDPKILELSKSSTNYTNDPRYHLFKKYAPGIKHMDDMKNVMRLNNVSDTGDFCDAIASRCDLDKTEEYPWGATDCKITSDKMVAQHQNWIISGPTTKNLPPFTWSDWPRFAKNISEIPKIFNFNWVYVDPKTNFTGLDSDSFDEKFHSIIW